MTQPLPNPTAKSAPADAASRLELGNFFQPAGPRQNSAGFDSFLPKEDFKDRTEKTEAKEKPQKNKKTEPDVICAEVQVPQTANPQLDSKPTLEGTPANTQQPIENTPELQTPAAKQESPHTESHAAEPDPESHAAESDTENTPDRTDEVPQKIEDEVVAEESERKVSDENPVADGMEVASNETDMVSLASIEDSVLSPLAPARDPLVTSSNRFSVSAALSERSAIAAISASSGEGGNSASLQGNPNLASPQHNAASKSEATATVLKNFAAELEKFRQSGQSQVQLELNVSENDTVKVRLQMRGDELRSTFITDSPELRDALQKAWPEFAQSSRDRGFRFGDPSFQNAYSQNDSPSQGRQGARDREANSEFAIPAKSTTSPRRAVTPAAARPALWA